MFNNCTGLTTLDISGINTSSVKSFSHLFDGCSGITSFNVTGLTTSAVTNMDYCFNNCSSITNLSISGWSTTAVTSMSYFLEGTALESFTLPTSIYADTTNGGIKYNNGSSTYNFPTAKGIATTSGSNTIVEFAMYITSTEQLATAIESNFVSYDSTNNILTFNRCNITNGENTVTFDNSTVKSKIESVTQLSDVSTVTYKFTNCNFDFTSSDMLNNNRLFRIASLTDYMLKFAFDTCDFKDYVGFLFASKSTMTSVTFTNCTTSNNTNMYCLFKDCSSLTSLNLSGWTLVMSLLCMVCSKVVLL